MFVLVRSLVYATLFVGLFLVFLPARLLERSGISQPATLGVWQWTGIVVGAGGAALVLWCVVTFALVGKGTPAVFDPPRRLVISGPYRFVRNPMYLGAGLALAGAALFYHSAPLLGYLALLAVIIILFVLWYEEPTLRRLFGTDYDAYCRRVPRWWPATPPRVSLPPATLR